MTPDEYTSHDGTALASLIRQRQVSPTEVWTAARSAIERADSSHNAVIGPILQTPLLHDAAGPFAGVPFALKDLGCEAQGLPQRAGSELTSEVGASRDSHLMTRWRSAGLAVLCRTTTPEFGLSCATESRLSGVTSNPLDPTLSSGGSSGGSAALVAAGALPWAHANDAAGSIRIPAALCGVVGLKPTRGLVPVGPGSDEPLFGLTSEFAITRTVRDSAALLEQVAGSVRGDRYQVRRPFDPQPAQRTGPRRIAFSLRHPFGGEVAPQMAAAVKEVAHFLEAQGHAVWQQDIVFDPDEFIEMSTRFWAASVSGTVAELGGFQSSRQHLLQATTRAFAAHGKHLVWSDIAQARTWQNDLTRSVAQWSSTIDVYMTPTVAQPAWPVGTLPVDEVMDPSTWMRHLFARIPFTPLANVTGQPAISVPWGSPRALPVGVQLTAAQSEDGLLLALGAAIEQERNHRTSQPTKQPNRK